MFDIIDTPQYVGKYAAQLASAGVRCVIRYYNHQNSSKLPTKALTRAELDQLHEAGLQVAVAFQQRGGAGGHLEDLSAAAGDRDARRALLMADLMAQPDGSGIYFCVDHDYYRKSELDQIVGYFTAVQAVIAGRFRVGVYGSGAVCQRLKSAGLANLFWVPGSMGWSGTRQFLQSGEWTLFQRHHDLHSEIGGIDYDANEFNPAFADFGQFSASTVAQVVQPAAAVGSRQVALFEVAAKRGLNLRAGPSDRYPILHSYPLGTVVHGIGNEGDWIKVDVTGDGNADGYMSRPLLRPLAGGLPLVNAGVVTPYQVAQAELEKNISEVAGQADNPRIVLYHSSTSTGPAPDETSWCSSFVNFCVERAGRVGTDSKWARSWHDSHWGQEVTASPRPGDIVVWRRRAPGQDGGHVAFFVSDQDGFITVLGGNQSNRVCIKTFPTDGMVGSTRYTLLSIRR